MKERFRKKSIRITLYLLGVLVAFILLINWLIRYHTKDLIAQLITSETKGKVKLEIGRFRFSFFPQARIDLHDTRVDIMDQPGQLPGYSAQFKHVGLQLQSLRSFLFDRQLLVDYFLIQDPSVTINPHVKKKTRQGNALLHTELGNIYIAVQRVAETMQVKKFGIFNGGIHIGRPGPDGYPMTLKQVDFQVDEFVMGKDENNSSAALQVRKLRLHTGPQDITFPNGDYRMKYSGLEINSQDNSVRIDSFYIAGKTRDTAYGALEAGFRNLRLVNIDFRTLYEKDLLKVDSIYCQDPAVRLHIDVTANRERKALKDSLARRRPRTTRGGEMPVRRTARNQEMPVELRIAELLGKLDVGYLGLINSDISVTTKKGNKYTPFTSQGNNFEAKGIMVNSDSAKPIRIENLVFAIKNYKASTADSLYDFVFDSVVFQRENLALKNFRLQPNEKNKRRDQKFVTIPDFELRNLSIQELATNQRLVADMLVLKNSRTINNYLPGTDRSQRGQPIRAIVREISRKVSLDKIRIENGYILSKPVNNPNVKIEVIGLHSEISANEMLVAPSYELMGYSVGNLSFDSALIHNEKVRVSLYKGRVRGRDQLVEAETFRMKNLQEGSLVEARHIRLKNYRFDDDLQKVRIDSIYWKSADINYVQPAHKGGPRKEIDGQFWSAGFVYLPSTRITFHTADGKSLRVHLDTFYVSEIVKKEGSRAVPQSLLVSGHDLDLSMPAVQARASRFRIAENRASFVEGLDLNLYQHGDSVQARIPGVYFVANLNQTLQKEFPILSSLQVVQPEIRVSRHGAREDSSTAGTKKPFRLQLGELSILEANLQYRQQQQGKSLYLRTEGLQVRSSGLTMGLQANTLALDKASIQSPSVKLSVNDSVHLVTYPGTFEVELADVALARDSRPDGLQATLKRLTMDQFNVYAVTREGKKPLELTHVSMGMEDLELDSLDKNHIIRQIKRNPSLFVDNIDFGNQDKQKEIRAFGIGFHNGRQELNIDSFYMRPVIDRDSFMRMQSFQKDYLQVHTGRILIKGLDLQKLLADSTIFAQSVDVEEPLLSVYKDKRIPYQWGIIKPLPTTMIRRISTKFNIDSIRLRNAQIRYEEVNDKTGKYALVPLTEVQGMITGLKNTDLQPLDSLRMVASATLLDTVRFRVGFRESYLDTLNGFLYSVRVRPFAMTQLNPILEPLAGAEISSGYLDTLAMRVVGREYIAHGKMKLYYRDLKVNILNKKDRTKKNVGTRFLNFVANLLIDKKNVKKTGSVYFERIREKGFVGYWVRILMAGAMTNTGIRSNSKTEKKYLRSVKKHQVPELPDIDL